MHPCWIKVYPPPPPKHRHQKNIYWPQTFERYCIFRMLWANILTCNADAHQNAYIGKRRAAQQSWPHWPSTDPPLYNTLRMMTFHSVCLWKRWKPQSEVEGYCTRQMNRKLTYDNHLQSCIQIKYWYNNSISHHSIESSRKHGLFLSQFKNMVNLFRVLLHLRQLFSKSPDCPYVADPLFCQLGDAEQLQSKGSLGYLTS